MKKINWDILLLTCVMCLLPILFGVYFYEELPEIVPVHFDINNNPDNFMSRNMFIFGTPVIMMLIQAFVCIRIDVSSKGVNKKNKSIFMYKLIIPFVSVSMYIVVILYAIAYGVDIIKCAAIILGVLFIVIGIDLPNTDNDSHINFPKINDEETYKKTKKVFGSIFIIDGLFALVSTLFNTRYLIGIVLLLLVEAIGLLLFAAWHNRKQERKKQ